MKEIEELQEALIPLFYAVVENNYDPETLVAYIEVDTVEGETFTECVNNVRELLVALLPDVRIVDVGGIYPPSNHQQIFAWWIQFKP